MIARLTGTIVDIQTASIIIDVQGVGYLVHVPLSVIDQVGLSKTATIHIHTAVREDAITLYGFATANDTQVFELLVGVSGVGPKLALAVVSAYTAAQIQTAISSGDSAAFTAVSGIGKKNAERIILELKNKVALPGLDTTITTSTTPVSAQLSQALIGLGYSAVEATKMGQGIDSTTPLEDQLRQALRQAASSDH